MSQSFRAAAQGLLIALIGVLASCSAAAPAPAGDAETSRSDEPAVAAPAPPAPASSAQQAPPEEKISQVRLKDVTLHYVDRGSGEPVVLIHGGLGDLREWQAAKQPLVAKYRTIAYSRRYNHPNDNPLKGNDHSAVVEAGDLAELIEKLSLGPVHVAGISYGAMTGLILAIRRPELLRTLTLVEPPLMKWLPELPDGPAAHDAFMKMWGGVGAAFKKDDETQALRLTVEYFVGPGAYEGIPPEFKAILASNAREWRALTTSVDSFPAITRQQVAGVRTPVLMLSGEKTFPPARIIDPALAKALPNVERKVLPGATHDMCTEQPDACGSAITAFLAKHAKK